MVHLPLSDIGAKLISSLPGEMQHSLLCRGAVRRPLYRDNVGRYQAPRYAPTFKEVEGAYWFGPVHLSVTPFVGCKTRERLELGT